MSYDSWSSSPTGQSYLMLLQATARSAISARLNISEYFGGGFDIVSTPRMNFTEASASAYSGEVLEVSSKEEIIKALECPVCKEMCVSPIWNCEKGHIVCNTCRPQLKECALCKSPISESRNYPLEGIATTCKFQCQYKPEGCTEILVGEKYTDHILNCSFRFKRPSVVTAHHANAFRHTLLDLDTPSASSDSYLTSDSDSEEDVSDSENFQPTTWVRAEDGHYPLNAVVGGTSASGEDLYVIRAYEGPVAVSGHLCPSDGAAYIVYQNRIRRKWYYDVLVAAPGSVAWINCRDGGTRYPTGTVVAKDDTCSHHTYVVGRARVSDGRFVCGNIAPTTDVHTCYYKDERRVGSVRRYFQILVARS